jgi:hypothetical protein
MEIAGAVDTIALDDLSEGAVLEVVEVAAFAHAKGTPPRAFLCMDTEMRFVTLNAGSKFIGGPSSDALSLTLKKLGFKPVFFGPVSASRRRI